MVMATHSPRWTWRALALGAATLSCSCEQALGIQDAELDPLLDAGPGLCTSYCDTVQSSCTDAHAVYTNLATCLGICAQLAEGQPGDQAGNTVECRLTQAENASSTGEPQTHCPFAAPGGNGTCGSNCDGYCQLFEQECPSYFDAAYASLGECQSGCAADLTDLGTYDVSMSTGATLQCRLWHLAAASVDPEHHCMHAAGESPCD
jgi:hypothetical protein